MSRRIANWQRALINHGFSCDRWGADGILGAATQRAINTCKDWQSWLNTRGFNAGPVDGWPGPKTDAAIKRFQAAAQIAIDGIVGSQTRNARASWGQPATNPAPIPQPQTSSGKGRLIALNASTQGYNGSPHIPGYSEAVRMRDLQVKVNHYLVTEHGIRTVLCPWAKCMNYAYNKEVLRAGIRAANQANADYFISFHTDAAGDPAGLTGSLVLYYSQKGKAFGEQIVSKAASAMGIPYKQARHKPGFIALKETKMPAVIIEVLNHMDADDCKLLADDKWLEQYAQILTAAIAEYNG